MNEEKAILVGGVVIITVGLLNAVVRNRPKTKVFVGGIGVILLASLLATFGQGPAKVAVGFIGVAVTAVLLVEAPPILTAFNNLQNKGKKQ